MDYSIIDWQQANTLKINLDGKLIEQLSFNFANVFLLKDSTFLVMPLNPFGKSILCNSKSWLYDCINKQYFPLTEKENEFYEYNKDFIRKMDRHKDRLISDLFEASGEKTPSVITVKEINEVYQILKKNKKQKDYKINMLALIGNYIIERDSTLSFKWGIIRNKQLLNPIMSIVIITDEKRGKYFDLEREFDKKISEIDFEYFIERAFSHNKTSNPIEEIVVNYE